MPCGARQVPRLCMTPLHTVLVHDEVAALEAADLFQLGYSTAVTASTSPTSKDHRARFRPGGIGAGGRRRDARGGARLVGPPGRRHAPHTARARDRSPRGLAWLPAAVSGPVVAAAGQGRRGPAFRLGVGHGQHFGHGSVRVGGVKKGTGPRARGRCNGFGAISWRAISSDEQSRQCASPPLLQARRNGYGTATLP